MVTSVIHGMALFLFLDTEIGWIRCCKK